MGQVALWAIELTHAEAADSEKSISTGLKRNSNVTFTPQKPPSGFFSLGGPSVSTLITHSLYCSLVIAAAIWGSYEP